LGILNVANISVPAAEYHSLKEIPVGGAGGFDYLTVDSPARRLYVSHGTKVVVIDLEKDAVVGEIADTPGIHGIAIAPELQRGFTSNGREAKASIFDPGFSTNRDNRRFIPLMAGGIMQRSLRGEPARSWRRFHCRESRKRPPLIHRRDECIATSKIKMKSP
jgi:hypothetical protein